MSELAAIANSETAEILDDRSLSWGHLPIGRGMMGHLSNPSHTVSHGEQQLLGTGRL